MTDVSLVPVVAPLEELQPLVERARSFAEAAIADNTRRAYLADWRGFAAWCTERGLLAESAQPAGVALYLAFLADKGAPPTTIERAYAGIASTLRRLAPDSWSRGHRPEVIVHVLAGIKRRISHVPAAKHAIAAEHLVRMLPVGDGLRAVRDRAILLMGFAGAFRRSELVALDASDLEFSERGLRVMLRRGKTDQFGQGRELGIAPARDPAHCPALAMRQWLAAAGIVEGPALRPIDRLGRVLARRLCDRTVADIVKRGAVAIGLNVSDFSGHSLRVGFVSAAVARGKGLDSIMRQTGHRSAEMVLRYIRHANIFVDNASDGLLG